MTDAKDTRDPRKRTKPELRIWKARKIPPQLIEWVGTLEPLLQTHLMHATQFYDREYPALHDPLPASLPEQAAAAYIEYVRRLMGKIDMLRPAEGSRIIDRLSVYTRNEHEDFIQALSCDRSIALGLDRMCQDFLTQSIAPELSKRMYALAIETGRGGVS